MTAIVPFQMLFQL